MSTTKEQKSRFSIIYKLSRIEPNRTEYRVSRTEPNRTECEVLKTRSNRTEPNSKSTESNRIESRFFYSFRSLLSKTGSWKWPIVGCWPQTSIITSCFDSFPLFVDELLLVLVRLNWIRIIELLKIAQFRIISDLFLHRTTRRKWFNSISHWMKVDDFKSKLYHKRCRTRVVLKNRLLYHNYQQEKMSFLHSFDDWSKKSDIFSIDVSNRLIKYESILYINIIQNTRVGSMYRRRNHF